MKKVLAIAPYSYLPFFSGGQKFIARFFETLATQAELTVISVPDNETELAKNYRLLPVLKKKFYRYFDISLVKKISKEVSRHQYDAIIWEHPYYAWLAFRIKKRTGIKTIIHTHNIEYQRFRSMGKWWWPLLKWYEKRSFQKADALFFIAPEDRNFAINTWGISPNKCFDLPFGINEKEYPADRASCRAAVCRQYNIQENEKIFLFSGLLNYKPNIDAVNRIITLINPVLQSKNFACKILICGKGLPPGIEKSLNAQDAANIIYTGFVSDIETYCKAADVFLNPVISGGGVKTKIVEAIGCGTTVISAETGAAGMAKDVCGKKLITTPDNNWELFARQCIMAAAMQEVTPQAYYTYYNRDSIIKRITDSI